MIAPQNSFLTGSQRLVFLFRYLTEAKTIRPSEYAKENGIRRQTVYYQLKSLQKMGFIVENVEHGIWELLPPELNVAPKSKLTPAMNLVNLYRDLKYGKRIKPSEYAKSVGAKRQTIYRQLDLLSQSGIPIYNDNGYWIIERFKDDYEN